ncbi:unnamed protein product [Peronospora destructor]|uniref:Post-SET domain-containing protein n=1 Tax=Peronospora destructor TaxID=86335 RepID=A0AAV0TBY9_9STRA|nr:unnamed protein product [Peronospora destructor]
MLRLKVSLISCSVASMSRRHFAISANVQKHRNGAQSHEAQEKGERSYVPSDSDGRFYIQQLNEHWRSVVAGQSFQKDDVIGTVSEILYPMPTRFTVQITPNKHMHFTGGLEFMNHSCNPNTRIKVVDTETKILFVAMKPIKEGEHLTFDYSTSEWDMDEKFDCRCGALKCRGHIEGAKYLSDDEVKMRLPYFTPSVLQQLLDRKLTN